ncbi:uncharacterized protein LOC127440828 isoform X2 [Myxocyprinus asiaticus]|uniref:uncharacterized protein LOC127440828 isoform X2 n=1 Tax=Myxocyprinus asiaticus TaxID=70543 RepID=UPI0022226895|nr:uncharacterized protein LOC127440828 isoform X2 [Myxocyprinus asiaticus]
MSALSSTSLPQQWHKPRGRQITPLPVTAVVVVKAKTKRKLIFCHYSNDRALSEVTDEDLELLRGLTGTPMSYIANRPPIDVAVGQEKYPLGSGLSYQLPLLDNTWPRSSLSNPTDDFPVFPLPPQPSTFFTVLTKNQMECYNAMMVSTSESEVLEKETRQQSINNICVRSPRLTSSSFKSVYSRKADYKQLATSMLRKKTLLTKAVKRGLELEPVAAAQYTEVTGNQVCMCGFVINPNAHHLGTSPDRKVLHSGYDKSYGHLEIKCPDRYSYTGCQYLQKHSGDTFSLKCNHEYYYQIIGQMGIMCDNDNDVCHNDYHLERIHFDAEMCEKIKTKLVWFFFEYFLPALCS